MAKQKEKDEIEKNKDRERETVSMLKVNQILNAKIDFGFLLNLQKRFYLQNM